MNSGRSKLLVVCDAVATTGFARLGEALIQRLRHHYDIRQIGINYYGPILYTQWPIIPTEWDPIRGECDALPSMMEQIEIDRPDAIILINDLSIIAGYSARIVKQNFYPPIIAYFPVDSAPLSHELVKPVAELCDRLVTYTEYAKKEIENLALEPRMESLLDKGVNVIPHGVDMQIFKPLFGTDEDGINRARREARTHLFPSQPLLKNAFIVLNANRNQPRKRIDLTMEGFAKFARDKPKSVLLHMHMGREDLGWNLTILARRLGISDRLLLSTTKSEMPSVPIETLNLIYNASDVGINTASAEGWGLCAFEHAACCRAQVISDLPTQREIWKDAAVLLPIRFTLTAERTLSRSSFTSADDVARSLDDLYTDKNHLRSVSNSCFGRCSENRFSWDQIAVQWIALIDQEISATVRQ